MYVNERFEFTPTRLEQLHNVSFVWGYGLFSEVNYYLNYSRFENVKQEHWHDTAIRVVQGMLSLRKDHYVKNRIEWDESYWQDYGQSACESLIRQKWCPAGRGLWAMGTNLVYERGAMPLYNCAYTNLRADNFVDDIAWLTDTIMLGCGVGFGPVRGNLRMERPPHPTHTTTIPDTREGWVDSISGILKAWIYGGPRPRYDYSAIRPQGSPLVTFGGVASGPEPLIEYHNWLNEWCGRYVAGDLDVVEFMTDVANQSGICMITGNKRRGAEIGVGHLDDPVFKHLKDYKQYPERGSWGWMSNNSVRLETDEDFERLDAIAAANIARSDLGYINMRNIPYGRIGKTEFQLRRDSGVGINPCGEIPLEHREVCNVGETAPTRCRNERDWYRAGGYCTTYCSSVALLPTHQPSTNAVVARNRRIGVSIIGLQDWMTQQPVNKITKYLREGYRNIRRTNKLLANEAGVPESIRVTTMKPGGTTPKVVGRIAGYGWPTFKFINCRVSVLKDHPMDELLKRYKVPSEPCAYSPNTTVKYSFPVPSGDVRPATDVSLWEQAMMLAYVQSEWADNAVSNTLYFVPRWTDVDDDFAPGIILENGHVDTYSGRKFRRVNNQLQVYNENHEEDDIERVLSMLAPVTKSVSLLPHSTKGAFKQMPQEGLSEEEFQELSRQMPRSIDWSEYECPTNIENDKYCSGPSCEVPLELPETVG